MTSSLASEIVITMKVSYGVSSLLKMTYSKLDASNIMGMNSIDQQ
jgi:hypothetical protein